MMLTIHGLPRSTKYHDLKVLIKQECNITDFILDSLLVDNDGTKKVRIGVTDDSDGTHMMKCLNGYRMSGHILKVMPVGKSALMNTPNQNAFDQRGAPTPYTQPRNDFPNQELNDYNHQGNNSVQEPIAGRHGPWVSNNQWVPNQPMAPSMQQSSYNYQQPTSQNVMSNNIYMQQQQPQAHRMPPQDPGYGFQTKNNIPGPGMATMGSAPPRRVEERGHTLRSVQIVDTSAPEHYPSHGHQQDKQISTQFNMGLPGQASGHYQAQGHGQVHPQVQGHPIQAHGQGPHSPWVQQQQKTQPFAKPNPVAPYEKAPTIIKNIQDPIRNVHDNYKEYDKSGRFSPQRRISPGRKSSPTGRRISPGAGPGRRMPSPGRRHSPSGRRISPSGHGYSASKRNASPPARRISPNDRRMGHSLDRRESSPRRMSPGRRPMSSGRRPISPGRRPISPGRRHISPGKRLTSPDRRPNSPGRRPVSPNRRPGSPGRKPGSPGRRSGPIMRRPGSPDKRDPSGQLRYSPAREYQDKMAIKYQEGRSLGSKQIRPAYDQSQAPNQAMYSGGYRPDVHEIVQYPVPGARVDQRNPQWQQERDKAMYAATMKKDGDRRDSRPNFDRNMHVAEETKRNSRSPIRRDRSPVRDRYKRQSPSPHSPRRSWALEKRRSPDAREAPPPPVWPGQNLRDDNKFSRDSRPNFQERNEKGEKSKRIPVWDRPSFDEKVVSRNEPRSEDAEQKFENQLRVRTDLQVKNTHREPSPRGHRYKPHDGRFPQQSQRDPPKFSSQEFHYADVPERSSYLEKADYRDFSPINKNRHDDNFPPRREDFQRRPEERGGGHNQSTEFDKDFDDIHKRTIDFHKRVEEFRRGDSKKKGEHVIEDRSRRNEADRETDESRRERYKPFSDIDENTRHRNESTRQGFRHQDEHGRRDLREEIKRENREPEWKFNERPAKKMNLNTSLKAKRDKAAEEITQKILEKHKLNLKGDLQRRIIEELKLSVSRVIVEMFGEQDSSYIEIIVKFDSKYGDKGEVKLLEEVMSSFPSQYRNLKRRAPESTEVSAKSIRRSPDANSKKDNNPGSNRLRRTPDWDMNVQSLTAAMNVNPAQPFGNIPMQMVTPMVMNPASLMVSAPTFVPTFKEVPENQIFVPGTVQETTGYYLYLCQDDFEPFSEIQANCLKQFLVAQIIIANESFHGWAPDITIKGLQSAHRYELLTQDEKSRDWLLNLDFSEFTLFNVLVYTKEELWYERAAIWLPGHSRCRNIEPLIKLKLQNKKLDGVNIGKWKFVKKIITTKGTRLYVDMPPSSARALEKHKMMLSYELQKVNVYLKAIAVDKDAFDAGLKEVSLKDQSEILSAAQNSPMPTIGQDPKIVKLCMKGNKTLTVVLARKIKEMLIYHIFKYHQQNGKSTTDFVKYGICAPSFFGVLPENEESKRWLMQLSIGKLNRQPIVILGNEVDNTPYIKMSIAIPNEYMLSMALVHERLKQSNQGVKGINFNKWKPIQITSESRNKAKFFVEVDLESIETLSRMKFKLDYVDDRRSSTVSVYVKYDDDKTTTLERLIKKCKTEMTDSYDVANMDIASESEDDVVSVN